MKGVKEVFLTVLFAMFFMPLVAGASYPMHQYPNITPIEKMQPNGKYIVYVEKEGTWQEVGSINFDMYFRERQIDLTSSISDKRTIEVRLVQQGGGAAHIDSVSLGDKSPIEVRTIENGFKKLSEKDFDVIEASNKSIEITFPMSRGNKILKLAARVESDTISKVPFQFPLANLYREMSPASKFYTYEMGTQGTGSPLFREYSLTGSGHPSGYTYGWVRHDKENLYVKIDFTPDNTMDGDKDYAAVYVQTKAGIKEFKVSMKEKIWGTPIFTYTDKVNYQHKVYDFAIPLKEIGIKDAKNADEINLAFAAYGTAAPPGGSFNPSSNNYLLVYPKLTDIYGQLVDSNGSPVGAEIPISTATNNQQNPSVAFNSSTNQYIVVWQDNRSGTEHDVYGQLVNANGTLSGSNFPVSTATNGQFNPSVAYNSSTNQYLVVWDDRRSGTENDIYGQIVNAIGTLSGSNFPVSTAANNQDYPSVVYNSGTNQYLVVWTDTRSGYAIYGQYLTSIGVLTGGDFFIVTSADIARAVANTNIGNYLVAYYSAGTYTWLILRAASTAIPTISDWGMIIFMVLAGLGAAYYLRRQRKAER